LGATANLDLPHIVARILGAFFRTSLMAAALELWVDFWIKRSGRVKVKQRK
jgi:hypothetical protein